MKKRIISMFLIMVMVVGMFPTAFAIALPQEETQELYIQMLQLGLVDENGALIEETVFIEADSGNILASNLTELRTMFESPDLDLSKTLQVWGTGGTATLEQLFVALAIEEQMAELASGLNSWAGGSDLMNASLTDTGFDAAAQIARHNLRLNVSIVPDSVTAHDDSLYLSLSLLDAEGYRATTTENVTVNIGLFADFLTENAAISNTAAIGVDPDPTINTPITANLTANQMTEITPTVMTSKHLGISKCKDTARIKRFLL